MENNDDGGGQIEDNKKRRERLIIRGTGTILKKIHNVTECDETISLSVKKYTAISSVLLCKGMKNARRLFVKDENVCILCPGQSNAEKVTTITKKKNGRETLFVRNMNEIEPKLELKEITIETFTAKKVGTSDSDRVRCYCITPVEGYDVWVDSTLIYISRKDTNYMDMAYYNEEGANIVDEVVVKKENEEENVEEDEKEKEEEEEVKEVKVKKENEEEGDCGGNANPATRNSCSDVEESTVYKYWGIDDIFERYK